MKIRYFGHAFFLLEGDQGPTIAIDPFDESVGYGNPSVKADIALASHGHFDHANVAAIGGDPETLIGDAGVGRHAIAGAVITGVRTRHYDDPAASARGYNTVYLVELDGLRVCHLGDLGHVLDDATLKQLGRVDVLMVPIGGFYTIDVKKVDKLVDLIGPRIVIPMHYRTPAAIDPGFVKIATKDAYLRGKKNVRDKASTIHIGPADLPAGCEIWVMAYSKQGS